MKKRYLYIYLFLLCPFWADAQIQLSNEEPVAGETVTISLDQPETQVVIAYRPNSSVVRRDTLRSDAPASEFSWTPQKAGVVALSTTSASRNVSVRFEGFSYPGLIVMLLAGGVLFGGVIFAFRVLFSKTKPGEPIDFDPSTRPDT
jgi:hypothetical protein